jgi:rhamnosyltransferase
MNKLAGVIVTYCPDKKELEKNIHSYLHSLDVLYVIDNTGNENPALAAVIKSISSKIVYIANNENTGIGAALNKAATAALAGGYTWLLTMDQDSYFVEEQLMGYQKVFFTSFFHRTDIAVLAPSYVKKRIFESTASDAYKEVKAVITSGSLIQLEIWDRLKGFEEKLFIDEVDHEYCYRAIQQGYHVILLPNIYFEHSLGTMRQAGYFGPIARRNRRIYPPARVYFMVRNYLYVRKKYRSIFSEEFKERDKQLLTLLKNSLLFSGYFWKSLKSILRGYRDFKRDDFSFRL